MKKRNRKFVDKTGEVFGDFTITNTFKLKGRIKYRMSCNKCNSQKEIFNTNYLAKERGKCFNCKVLSLIGKKIGMLTIISVVSENCKKTAADILYTAMCECKREILVKRKALLSLTRNSCGCNDNSARKIIFKYKYSTYKNGAKTRNLSFDLTYKEFEKLISSDCFYCGAAPKLLDFQKFKWIADFRKKEKVFANGIDRVDNNMGYQSNNVVPCCVDCNTKKMAVTLDIAKKMTTFLNKNKHVDNVVIEISAGNKFKYEIDKDTQILKLDRPLNQECPVNYGYYNLTLAEDGDPADVFVISNSPIVNLTYVSIDIIGAFICEDSGCSDDKIVSVLLGENLEKSKIEGDIEKIKKYLNTYKKGFVIKEFVGKKEAQKIIEKSKKAFNKKN